MTSPELISLLLMSLPEHNADTQGCERGKRSRYAPPLPSAAHSGKLLYFVNSHNTKASVIGSIAAAQTLMFSIRSHGNTAIICLPEVQ